MFDLRRAGAGLAGGALAALAGAGALALALLLQPGERALRAAALLYAPAAAAAAWQGEPAAPAAAAAVEAQPAPQPRPHSPAAHGHARNGPHTPSPAPEPTPAPVTTAPPDLEGAGDILPRTYAQGGGEGYVTLAAGSIRNSTEHSDAELAAAAEGPLPFAVELDSAEPQVLILHTHATECYQPWEELVFDPAFSARTEDKSQNMCAVGARMAQVLNAAGVNTLHDTTLHDSPSYTESYARKRPDRPRLLRKIPQHQGHFGCAPRRDRSGRRAHQAGLHAERRTGRPGHDHRRV